MRRKADLPGATCLLVPSACSWRQSGAITPSGLKRTWGRGETTASLRWAACARCSRTRPADGSAWGSAGQRAPRALQTLLLVFPPHSTPTLLPTPTPTLPPDDPPTHSPAHTHSCPSAGGGACCGAAVRRVRRRPAALPSAQRLAVGAARHRPVSPLPAPAGPAGTQCLPCRLIACMLSLVGQRIHHLVSPALASLLVTACSWFCQRCLVRTLCKCRCCCSTHHLQPEGVVPLRAWPRQPGLKGARPLRHPRSDGHAAHVPGAGEAPAAAASEGCLPSLPLPAHATATGTATCTPHAPSPPALPAPTPAHALCACLLGCPRSTPRSLTWMPCCTPPTFLACATGGLAQGRATAGQGRTTAGHDHSIVDHRLRVLYSPAGSVPMQAARLPPHTKAAGAARAAQGRRRFCTTPQARSSILLPSTRFVQAQLRPGYCLRLCFLQLGRRAAGRPLSDDCAGLPGRPHPPRPPLPRRNVLGPRGRLPAGEMKPPLWFLSVGVLRLMCAAALSSAQRSECMREDTCWVHGGGLGALPRQAVPAAAPSTLLRARDAATRCCCVVCGGRRACIVCARTHVRMHACTSASL